VRASKIKSPTAMTAHRAQISIPVKVLR